VKKKKLAYLALFLLVLVSGMFLVTSCGDDDDDDEKIADDNDNDDDDDDINDDDDDSGEPDPLGRLRVAAEWEPALGALIGWPLVIPPALVQEIAEEDKLFVMAKNEFGQQRAETAFTGWGIDLEEVTFIIAPQGGVTGWTRDWGPHALFDEDLDFSLADPRFLDYPFSGPDCDGKLIYINENPVPDDAATVIIAETLGLENTELPFSLTGGNVMFDGLGTAFSTCIMTNENRYHGISDEEFFDYTQEYLGISEYHIVSNFESMGIQHIDCLLKLLDEERILVAQAPVGHENYERYEKVVEELSQLENAYGRPYTILRIQTETYDRWDSLAAYTNSLVLNERIFVPTFDIDQDEQALQTWRDVMPGYEVIGIPDDGSRNPWASYDALHCRTRAIWDPQMLYMTHQRLSRNMDSADEYPIEVRIIDYSQSGLIEDQLLLHWRLEDQSIWTKAPLQSASEQGLYTASIHGVDAGQTANYYILAADQSGRTESLPRTAPDGYYTFEVNEF